MLIGNTATDEQIQAFKLAIADDRGALLLSPLLACLQRRAILMEYYNPAVLI
jgi:hypothetical protein